VGMRSDLREVFVTEAKFLAFRPVRPDMKRLGWHFLALGLVSSWLAGLGRYWDTPEAQWWQYAGLGSVVYTLFMAALLWALIWPLHPENWSYLNVLTFVGMTAPPAIFYAIPVERFATPYVASQVNYLFLLVVASWRVALLWFYLRRAARLVPMVAFFALSLPLSIILVLLGYFQLFQIVFEGMAGNRAGQSPPNLAGATIVVIGIGSLFSFPFLLIGYLVMTVRIQRKKDRESHIADEQISEIVHDDDA